MPDNQTPLPQSDTEQKPAGSPQPNKSGKPLWKRLRFWLRLLSLCLLTSAVAAGLVALWVSKLDITKLENPLPDPTLVFDRYGGKFAQLSSSRIEPVSLDKIPTHLRNAVIATEDRRFYEHPGVDVQSIGRALWRDLKTQGFAEGGSTITQQLAKNLFLPTDKTLSRKLKEAAYALKIDMIYGKDEILDLYLNSIYFGEGQYGVQGAAAVYFNKRVEDLNLEECALIAGLPKAPSVYSPIKNKERALERRNIVLALMKEQNFISEADYEKAKAAPIALRKSPDDGLKNLYTSYSEFVLEEAVQKYGFTEEQIRTGGLRIYTHLDQGVQLPAEAVYRDNQFFPESKPDQLIQSGVVILDHKTGALRGLVGRRDDGVVQGLNYATKLVRQPGSTFKPLAVYAPALEKGYTPSSVLYDGELNINGYRPKNWDNRTRGQVTLEEAVTKSGNIPAVWLLNEIGIDAGLDFVKRVGIPLKKEDRQLGLALGGLSDGVTALQMAQAFGTFPNLGVMVPAHAIAKITTKDGAVLVEAAPKPVRVTTAQVAYTMTGLLGNVVRAGTGTIAALDRPTAGKTGTTELPETAEFQGISGGVSKDAWFVGYTPELTAAFWLGYDKTDKNHYLTTSGSAVPARLFKEIMARALSGQKVVPFPTPELPQQAAPLPSLSLAPVLRQNQPAAEDTGNKDRGNAEEKAGKNQKKKEKDGHD